MEKLVDIPMPSAAHPYYPVEAEIVGYLANEYSTPMILTVFLAGCSVIIGLTSTMINRRNRNLPTSEKITIMWFAICKSCHMITAVVDQTNSALQVAVSISSLRVGSVRQSCNFLKL